MNNYAQITIGEKPVGLKFSFDARELFNSRTKIKPDIYFPDDNWGGLAFSELLYSAYIINCTIKKVNPELTLEDFYSWYEDIISTEESQKELVRVMNICTVAWGGTIPSEVKEETDVEKKSE